jgi:hypothetical protein
MRMANPPEYPTGADSTGRGSDSGLTAGTPRWVKVFGIIAVVVVVLVIIVLLVGGHGPGRHTGGLGGQTSPAGAIEGGVRLP